MSNTFTDSAGRTWTPAVTVDAVKRVKTRLKCDLLALFENDGRLIDDLINNPILLADVVFVLCESQAKEQGVSDEQFGQALGGDAIEEATAAVLENLIDFFPSQRRTVLRKAVQKLNTLQARIIERVAIELDSPALDKQMEELLANPNPGPTPANSSSLSGDSPGPPGSTQVP